MTSTNPGIDGVFLRRATTDDAAQVQAILNSEVSAIDPTHGSFGIDIATQIIESPGDPSPRGCFPNEMARNLLVLATCIPT